MPVAARGAGRGRVAAGVLDQGVEFGAVKGLQVRVPNHHVGVLAGGSLQHLGAGPNARTGP